MLYFYRVHPMLTCLRCPGPACHANFDAPLQKHYTCESKSSPVLCFACKKTIKGVDEGDPSPGSPLTDEALQSEARGAGVAVLEGCDGEAPNMSMRKEAEAIIRRAKQDAHVQIETENQWRNKLRVWWATLTRSLVGGAQEREHTIFGAWIARERSSREAHEKYEKIIINQLVGLGRSAEVMMVEVDRLRRKVIMLEAELAVTRGTPSKPSSSSSTLHPPLHVTSPLSPLLEGGGAGGATPRRGSTGSSSIRRGSTNSVDRRGSFGSVDRRGSFGSVDSRYSAGSMDSVGSRGSLSRSTSSRARPRTPPTTGATQRYPVRRCRSAAASGRERISGGGGSTKHLPLKKSGFDADTVADPAVYHHNCASCSLVKEEEGGVGGGVVGAASVRSRSPKERLVASTACSRQKSRRGSLGVIVAPTSPSPSTLSTAAVTPSSVVTPCSIDSPGGGGGVGAGSSITPVGVKKALFF